MFIQTLARMLADKIGLNVEYRNDISTFMIGKKEADDRLTIYLATKLIEAAGESEDSIGVLTRGALAHEALGHGYHTDFEEMATEGRYALSVANAFEDVRIEKRAPERFLGARKILSDMVMTLERDFGFWKEPAVDDWQTTLLLGLLRKYRTSILKQPLDAAVTKTLLDRSRQDLGDALFTEVDRLAEKACLSDSTKEVNACADAIVRLLRQPQEDNQSQDASAPDDGDGSPDTGDQGDGNDAPESAEKADAQYAQGSDGDNADTADDGDADTTDEVATDGATPQEPADKADAGCDADQTATPDDSAQQTAESTPATMFDPDMECQVDIESAMDEVFGSESQVINTPGLATEFVDVSDQKPTNGDHFIRSSGSRLAASIGARLHDALRSITEDEDDSESDMGRLDMSRLPDIVPGMADRPFIEDGEPGREINTEVMLVFDASSSMNDLNPEFLRGLLHASATALSRFAPDLSFNVATFNTGSRLVFNAGQTWTPARASMVAAGYQPSGGTRWAESITPLVPILASSRHPRRILLTVCDGYINHDRNPEVMRELDAFGIETVFVTIGSPLPDGCAGSSCDTTQEAFAKAFCDVLLGSIAPQFA